MLSYCISLELKRWFGDIKSHRLSRHALLFLVKLILGMHYVFSPLFSSNACPSVQFEVCFHGVFIMFKGFECVMPMAVAWLRRGSEEVQKRAI